MHNESRKSNLPPPITGERSFFDGTSGEQLRKWMAEVDNIHLGVDNDKLTLTAASRLLKGSPLEYFNEIALTLQSWDHFKGLMLKRYEHLDDAELAKHNSEN